MKKYEETGRNGNKIQHYPWKLIPYFKMDMLTLVEYFFFFFTFLGCGYGVWGMGDLFNQVQNIPKKIIQISTTGRR